MGVIEGVAVGEAEVRYTVLPRPAVVPPPPRPRPAVALMKQTWLGRLYEWLWPPEGSPSA